MISLSPITKESNDEATLKRCSAASFELKTLTCLTAELTDSRLQLGLKALKKFLIKVEFTVSEVTKINSTLLQVERYINSFRLMRSFRKVNLSLATSSSRWKRPILSNSKLLCVNAKIYKLSKVAIKYFIQKNKPQTIVLSLKCHCTF